MHVQFESSGGYVPLRLVYNFETAELPPEIGSEVERLVESTGFLGFQPGQLQAGFPDMTSYNVTIRDEGASNSVRVNDQSGAPLMPLLSYLRNLAMERGTKL